MPESNIYNELTTLQNELLKLSSAVKLIDEAKKTSVAVIETGEQLNKRYDSQNKKVQEQIVKLDKILLELEESNFPKKFNEFQETLTNMWIDTHNRLNTLQIWIYILTGVCSLTILLVSVLLTS